MGRIIHYTLIALGIIAVIFVAGSWAFACYFIGPPRTTPIMPNSALALQMESVSFLTEDSLTIRGWYLPPVNPRGAVLVLLHGYMGNRTHMLAKAELLHDAGYGALLYDARGSGESDGEMVSMGYYESADLVAAIRFLRDRGVSDIGCIGVSQGGATIALAAGRLDGVRCAILESTYDDMEHAIDRRFRTYLGVPGWLGASVMAPIAERKLGCSTSLIAPVDHIGKLSCPIFIMGGAVDTRVPPEDTRRLFDAARGPKELWIVPGADHEDLQAVAPEEYDARVLAFLKSHLPLR